MSGSQTIEEEKARLETVIVGDHHKEFAQKLKDNIEKESAMREENKATAKQSFKLTEKEKAYLATLSKKERKKFINKSLGRDENFGITGPSKQTPFGKRYF